MKGYCKECTLLKPLDPNGRCAACAPLVAIPSQPTPVPVDTTTDDEPVCMTCGGTALCGICRTCGELCQ